MNLINPLVYSYALMRHKFKPDKVTTTDKVVGLTSGMGGVITGGHATGG